MLYPPEKIFIYSMDFKFYYNVVRILETLGIKAIHRTPQDNLPSQGLVVSTLKEKKYFSRNGFESDNGLKIVFLRNSIQSQEEFLSLIYRNIDSHDELIIGLDPGKHVGVYIEADGNELSRFVSVELTYIQHYIEDIHKRIPSKRYILKVGNGIGFLDVLKQIAFPLKDSFQIYIVNEENTSSIFKHDNNSIPRILRNELSAREIARREGVFVKDIEKFISNFNDKKMLNLSDLRKKS